MYIEKNDINDQMVEIEKVETQITSSQSDKNSIEYSNKSEKDRAITILKMSTPMSFACIIFRLQEVINLIYIGKLKNKEMLAGVGMGNMTGALISYAIIGGFNQAADTLISQGAGAKKYEQCGIVLNRGRAFIILMYIPAILLFLNTGSILSNFVPQKEVADYAQQYLNTQLFAFFLAVFADLQRRFLSNFGLNELAFLGTAISTPLHILWCQIFMVKYEMGIAGLGVANTLTYFILCFVLVFLTSRQKHLKEAVFWPDMRVFNVEGLKQYWSLGWPSSLMISLDIWVWELLVLISGYFGVLAQDATLIVMNVILITYQFAAGLEFVSCATVGYFVGARNTSAAKQYTISLTWVTIILVLISSSLLGIFKAPLISLLTPMPDIQKEVLAIMWIICLQMIPDCIKGTYRGVIKARGLQFKAMLINMSGHWCVNLSLIWLLGFKLKMGIAGIWLAKLVLELYIMTAYLILVWTTDISEALEEIDQTKPAVEVKVKDVEE